jgi:predicted 3-demethylubiquinone-9 3-methyltransferase (glyoxalase superfamily)
VNCETQEEVDELWDKLSAGGEVFHTVLITLLTSTDAASAQRAMMAMLQMKKIDISLFEQAYKNA